MLPTHGRYEYVPIVGRPDYRWPGEKRLAVYIALNLEHFAFGEGLGAELAPGGPQPDVLNYAWRDYGNRVGAWRMLELFDALNLPVSVLVNSEIYSYCPQLMDAFRAINELVVAAIFVAAVGLGPFAGVMALALHTTGVLAKLFSEAVEAIDDGPVEGVRATGAGPVNEVVWGVIPQVIPLWASYALYRFESNTRAATILGLIGAGGIGQLLIQNIRSFEYGKTATILLIIIAAVTAVDLISQMLRRRLV